MVCGANSWTIWLKTFSIEYIQRRQIQNLKFAQRYAMRFWYLWRIYASWRLTRYWMSYECLHLIAPCTIRSILNSKSFDSICTIMVPFLNHQQLKIWYWKQYMKTLVEYYSWMYPSKLMKHFYLFSLVSDAIQPHSQIVLAVQWSEITTTLLKANVPHSALKLPWYLHTIYEPTCNTTKTSAMAKLRQNYKVLI